MNKDFILPDIGEGIVQCEVIEWKVSEGEFVEEDQVIVEVSTDKAIVEIPCIYRGQITKLYYMVGDTADVNSPEYQATMGQYADTQPALMNRDGSMGPGAEPTMGDGTQRTDADVANAVRDRYGNLMQRNEYGGLGDTDISGTVPEVEDEVTSTDVEVEEAPYGRNPNTGEPLPEPPKGKGGSRLMQLANRINPYAR